MQVPVHHCPSLRRRTPVPTRTQALESTLCESKCHSSKSKSEKDGLKSQIGLNYYITEYFTDVVVNMKVLFLMYLEILVLVLSRGLVGFTCVILEQTTCSRTVSRRASSDSERITSCANNTSHIAANQPVDLSQFFCLFFSGLLFWNQRASRLDWKQSVSANMNA